MNPSNHSAPQLEAHSFRTAWRLLVALISSGVFGFAIQAYAYPPAPDYTFYGKVRNEWGEPIDVRGATVFLLSTNGSGATAPIAASTLPGINYRLIVPMDSARSLKADIQPGERLKQNQPFRLKVKIGAITYLPIEMVVSRSLGEPAGTSRVDLTLGVDTDGDGLPDVWELANGLDPNNPNDANGDNDGDGISNRDEYLAGTYAFDANDGFRLAIVAQSDTSTSLEFFAVSGRNYSIQSSVNLEQWTPVSFRLSDAGAQGALQTSYFAADHKNLRIEVPVKQGTTNRFFRAVIQ